jgi:hypothetical protein
MIVVVQASRAAVIVAVISAATSTIMSRAASATRPTSNPVREQRTVRTTRGIDNPPAAMERQ